MLLTVVIPTFNRREVLKRNLDEFKNQTDKEFEVVVAIDGSIDDTEEMLEEYKKTSSFEIRWVNTGETDKFCVAKARNMGILESNGDAVMLLDDDSFATPDLVKEHKRTVRRKTFTGGMRTADDPEDQLHRRMSYYKTHFKDKLYYISDHPKFRMIENNCCMYREDWIKAGMFTERIEGYGGVGQELSRRLHFQGYLFQFNPKAIIIHHREFEGDNKLTREEKMRQSEEMQKVLSQYGYVRKKANLFKKAKLLFLNGIRLFFKI